MAKARILIVDDEPGLIRVMTLMLTSLERYEVLSVLDGTLALKAVLKFKPHLVLLDWIMPGINGGDIVQQIRADSRVSKTLILFLTATVKGNAPQEICGIPAIGKPIGIHELVEAIEEQLRKGE
jgi:DNA-binding response OmpR family regulator